MGTADEEGEEDDVELAVLKRDKYRLKSQRSHLREQLKVIRRQLNEVSEEINDLNEQIARRRADLAGGNDVDEAVVDVELDLMLREVAPGLPPDRRVPENEVIQQRADSVGTTPERFIELMNKRYPWDEFDQSTQTNYDVYASRDRVVGDSPTE